MERRQRAVSWLVRVLLILGLCLYTGINVAYLSRMPMNRALQALEAGQDVCPQEPEYDLPAVLEKLQLQLKRAPVERTVSRLSRAVQIDTSLGDNFASPDKDPAYWTNIFRPFRKFLEREFPLVHRKMTREIVNEHGLLFTWPGADSSLKPLVLMAHQDVVPVANETRGQWRAPPFGGEIDLEHQTVWGRGSFDCKSVLISTMVAVENLIESGFRPNRTIILSYGFDEESGGFHGAKSLGETLYERLGPDSVAMILDEGFNNVPTDGPGSVGMPIATPSVQEKGFANVNMVIHAPGGHSSMPPAHTSIGIMSEMLAALEAKPFAPKITSNDPSIIRLQCTRNAPGVNSALRNALYELEWAERLASEEHYEMVRAYLPYWARALHKRYAAPMDNMRLELARKLVLDELSRIDKTFFQTTQAIDLIHGGVKINALPESVTAGVNHRIVPYATAEVVRDHYREVVLPIAKKHGLDVNIFGEHHDGDSARGTLEVALGDNILEQLPQTPIAGAEAAPWRLLSGVIRYTFHIDEPRIVLPETEIRPRKSEQPLTVAPGTMIANTDSHWLSVCRG